MNLSMNRIVFYLQLLILNGVITTFLTAGEDSTVREVTLLFTNDFEGVYDPIPAY